MADLSVQSLENGMDPPGDECLHVDVFLDEVSPRAGITELLKILRPHWRSEDVQLKVFTEGITNQLVGCSVGSGGTVVLVRLYGRMTELFVDRKKEMDMMKLLHSHGCGPQLYCSFQNGICYEFIKGVALDDVLLQQPSIYRLVAVEMGKIHSIKIKSSSVPGEPVLWSKISNFLQLLQNSKNHKDPPQRSGSQVEIPSIEVLRNEMEELKRHLNRVESPTVLCHNDLLTKNIIYNSDEGMVKFIDYEYADFNYQAFDIGNHFNEFAGVNNVDYSMYPSLELQLDWLREYLQSLRISSGLDSTITDRDVHKLYVEVCKFSLASNLLWGIWALLQAKYSTINFDFLRYAAARLSYYFEKKTEYISMAIP